MVSSLLSISCSLSCDVPKGTILGPLPGADYFHYYFYHILTIFPTACQIASLGCTLMTPNLLTRAIYNIHASLTEDLENVHYWLRANKLALNMTKTEVMLIGSEAEAKHCNRNNNNNNKTLLINK